MTKRNEFRIGDRVEGGEGEDHDTGFIHEIKGDEAYVGWESGVSTWTTPERCCRGQHPPVGARNTGKAGWRV